MQPLGKSGSHPIVFDPSVWSYLNANRQPAMPAPTATAAPKKGGRGGFLTSLISELGGAGGAASGAAAGAALGSVVPGLGTAIGGIAGGILGGFAGGTGGRLVENKVRDNQWNAGSALKEGGLDAALSGLGTGFQAIKGLRYAKNLTKVLPEADGVAQAPQHMGILERAGYNLKSAAGGYGTGARLNGEKIGMGQSQQIDDLLNKLKIPSGSPEFRQAQLEGHINNMGDTLTNLYGKNVQRIQPTTLGQQIMTDVNKLPLLDSSAKKSAQDFIDTQLKGVKNTNDLWGIIKQIDANKIKWGGSPSAKLVDREAVARTIRSNIRDVLNKKLPGVANVNSLYHDAVNANELLKGISANSGGGLVSKITNLSPVKAVESKLGSATEKLGKVSAGTGGKITKVTNQAKFQAPGNLAEAMPGVMQPQNGVDNTQIAVPDSNLPGGGGGSNGPSPYYDPTDPFGAGSQLTDYYSAATSGGGANGGSGPAYSEQNLMADISRDPKHMADYLNLYKTLTSLDSAGNKSTKLGASQQQAANNANNGMTALNTISGIIQSDPHALVATDTPGQSLPLVGGFIGRKTGDNASVLHTARNEAADVISRLRTGAAINSEEERFYKNQLPRAGDSPATISYKLGLLNQLFSRFANPPSSGGGSSMVDMTGGGNSGNLSDILQTLQTQGAY